MPSPARTPASAAGNSDRPNGCPSSGAVSIAPAAIKSAAAPKLFSTAMDPSTVISSLYMRNGDRAGARLVQELQQQQAHGARAGQQDVLADDRADAAQAVHRAGQRLDQGSLGIVHAVRDAVGVSRGHGDVLGEGAVDRVPDGV